MEQLSKDPMFIILSELNDKDLFNFCLTSKKIKELCSNDDFWRNRLIKKYPNAVKHYQDYSWYYKYSNILEKCFKPVRTWRQYYLHTVYYISKMKETFNFIYQIGNPQYYYMILFCIKQENIKERLAASLGYLDLLKHLTPNLLNVSNVFYGAAEENQMHIIEYYWRYPAIWEINIGLLGAIQGEHLDMVKFFIEKGANNIDDALRIAKTLNNKNEKIIKLLEKIIYQPKYEEVCSKIKGKFPPLKLLVLADVLKVPYDDETTYSELCGKVKIALLL